MKLCGGYLKVRQYVGYLLQFVARPTNHRHTHKIRDPKIRIIIDRENEI